MIVLDYLKRTHNDTVLVPPFHTGHLGLLPDTLLHVGLIAYPAEGEHCELVITPYEQSSDKAYVHCTMRDQPGVVQRLVSAVSILGINIELQESSAINRLNHHSVNLLIDWSSSELRARHSTRRQVQRYNSYQANFPITEERYVRLFESIIAHCGHLIVWDELAHARRPHLFMRPLAGHQVRPHANTKVQRHEKEHSYQVRIPIPDEVLGPLHTRLGTAPGTNLPYILLSETDERVLRIFFPRPRFIPRIFHIAFYHKDLPGALSAITDLLAADDFNILTSLLRKTSSTESVWEAMLEYRGSAGLPEGDISQRARWLATRLSARAAQDRRNLSIFEFSVGLPLYPKHNKPERFPLKGSTLVESDFTSARPDTGELLLSKINEARNALAGDKDAEQLLQAVTAAIEKRRPSIFLSFPQNAREHVVLITSALPDYEIIKYELHGAEAISDKVLELVTRADYYIGIWHHDETLPTTAGKYGISPWMPFEYGIATALGKPRMVLHSEKLDERIWKRIDAGIATPEYSDLRFKEETLPRMVEYCRANFAEQRRMLD